MTPEERDAAMERLDELDLQIIESRSQGGFLAHHIYRLEVERLQLLATFPEIKFAPAAPEVQP